VLQARDLTKDFGRVRALSGVSVEVAEGTVHALVGASGAGKTTFLNLVSGFLEPTSGSVRFRGEDVTGRTPGRLGRLGIVRALPVPSVFDGLGAAEHVGLALASPAGVGYRFPGRRGSGTSASRLRAVELLDLVGLGACADVAAGALAPAQRRALALAVALAHEPCLLLVDEPTSGLPVAEVDRLVAVLERVAHGRTVVIVEHDLRVVASLADAVTELESGVVTAAPLRLSDPTPTVDTCSNHAR
jgi:branched-chain amino acid transport system ATP-binding protein